MSDETQQKVKKVMADPNQSAFGKYKRVTYGNVSTFQVILSEVVILFTSWVPGALGLGLRKLFYPILFEHIGRNVVFGRNITLRHPHKIILGNNVIIDDNAVIDAKGDGNDGIRIGDNVYVGRNTIIYCKGGDIAIGKNSSISSNCQLFSSNKLTVGPDTVIGAFSYLLSGGTYDYENTDVPFAQQDATDSEGEVEIGTNCWISAHVTVMDGAGVGDHCVIGAGAVVTKPIPPDSIAVGIPAKVVKSI